MHCQTQNGVEKGAMGQEGNREGGGDVPRTYRMAVTTNARTRHFPVEGFSGQTTTWTSMRVHFWHRHVQDTVVILEEGNLPHTRCSLCNILVP